MWNTTIMLWVSDNAGAVFAGTLLVLCVATVIGVAVYDRRASIKAYWEHRRTIRIQRGLVMGRKKNADRKAYVKGTWADIITHGGETAFFEGRLTRDEVNDGYRMFGKTHNIPDLIPVFAPEALKAAIRGRRARGIGTSASPAQEKPAWGDPPVAPPTTAAVVDDKTNVIQAAKKFGAKALAKLQKTA